VFLAKVHGKLYTKIQERGAGGEELSLWIRLSVIHLCR